MSTSIDNLREIADQTAAKAEATVEIYKLKKQRKQEAWAYKMTHQVVSAFDSIQRKGYCGVFEYAMLKQSFNELHKLKDTVQVDKDVLYAASRGLKTVTPGVMKVYKALECALAIACVAGLSFIVSILLTALT